MSIEPPRQLPAIVFRELRFGYLEVSLSGTRIRMAINDMVHLRYIGVIPQTECLEYGFRIEDKDKDPRLIVLMIESDFFKKYELKFQEAPDLCYQKLLADIRNETVELPVSSRLIVTAADIAHYRELHPSGKSTKYRSNRSNAAAF
jgi:hypothetical protein